MRLLFGLTLGLLVATWVFAGVAAWAPDVEHLPGHDLSVRASVCRDCHAQRIAGAPAYGHAFAPTCGFCHRQSLPTAQPAR